MIIDFKHTDLKRDGKIVAFTITWKGLKAGDVGVWCEAIGLQRSAHLYGTLNGKCIIEGSNDSKNAGFLNSEFGVEASLKDNGRFVKINEASFYIRPNVLIGDENTNVTVSVMVVL